MSKPYGEMLTDWAKAGGMAIIIHDKTQQWDEWMLYFHQFQIKWIFALLEGRQAWTVPTPYPGDFDNRFNAEIGRRNMASKASRQFAMPNVRAPEMTL